MSQTKRKSIEKVFGWLKTIGLMPKTRHRGAPGWFAAAVYNLLQIRNLTGRAA